MIPWDIILFILGWLLFITLNILFIMWFDNYFDDKSLEKELNELGIHNEVTRRIVYGEK